MKPTDRKLIDAILKIRGRQSEDHILVGKIHSISPLQLNMYDQIIKKHIYLNDAYTCTSDSEISNSLTWGKDDDKANYAMFPFLQNVLKKQLLHKGDMVIVLQSGISFYILERVVKMV